MFGVKSIQPSRTPEGRVTWQRKRREKSQEKTFIIFPYVTVHITVIWYNNSAKGKQALNAKAREGEGQSHRIKKTKLPKPVAFPAALTMLIGSFPRQAQCNYRVFRGR